MNLSKLQRFIKKDLPSKLEDDLKKFRIVREADLQSCVYFHLRRLADDRWKIYSEKYGPQCGHFVDLLICESCPLSYKPRLAIELKWNRKKMPEKDRRSLRKALRNLKVHKAYFITTVYGARGYEYIQQTQDEKRKLFEIVVRLPDTVDTDSWNKRRRRLKQLSDLSRRKSAVAR